jgi:DNA-binding IclR family transcriptional regulator
MSAQVQILVANEPPIYRDLLRSQRPHLRPNLTILLVDPADLDDALAQMRPRLVICSESTDSIRQHGIAALVLDPHGANEAILDVDGQQQVLLNPRLTDLLAAIDSVVTSSQR